MSQSSEMPNAEVVGLLAEATAWRMIALLFECPREGWYAELLALAAEATDPDLQEAVREAQREANEGLYHTTFGPGGPAAPREVSYRDSLLAGQTIGQLRDLYEAFAYHPAIQEASDHVAVLAGFASYLFVKEAYARLRGDTEQAAIAAAAAECFLAEHLSVVAHPLAQSLAESGTRYLAIAGHVLAGRVGGPRGLPLPPLLSEQESS